MTRKGVERELEPCEECDRQDATIDWPTGLILCSDCKKKGGGRESGPRNRFVQPDSDVGHNGHAPDESPLDCPACNPDGRYDAPAANPAVRVSHNWRHDKGCEETEQTIRALEDAERTCKAANESQCKTIRALEAELARRLRSGTMYELSKQVDDMQARAEKAEARVKELLARLGDAGLQTIEELRADLRGEDLG